MTKNQKRRFRCNFCVASFDWQKLLNAHWVTTHSLLACRWSVTCKSVFSNSVNRRIHEKAFHLGGGRWVCDHCGAQFVFISQLLKHNVKHSSMQKYRCKEKHCSKAFKRKVELLDHTKIHEGAQLSCDVDGCEYMTHLKKRLTDHQAVHRPSDSKRYNCARYGKQYNYRWSMSIHCKICNSSTSSNK